MCFIHQVSFQVDDEYKLLNKIIEEQGGSQLRELVPTLDDENRLQKALELELRLECFGK